MFHFDPHDCVPGKSNYWGYSPIGFFCPHPAYSSRRDVTGPVNLLEGDGAPLLLIGRHALRTLVHKNLLSLERA